MSVCSSSCFHAEGPVEVIDIHCHLLPGIDDGAGDLDESLALCRHAVRSGITHAVVTPHIHPGRWDNDRVIIAEAYAALTRAVADAGLPLTLGMASEVRISAEMLTLIPDGKVPFLGEYGGEQVLLLELPHGQIPPGAEKLVGWLRKRNIRPMIAHPERNKGFMRDRERLQAFVDAECLFQLTAGAVAGSFGEQAEDLARYILEQGWVTVLASDAHNLKARPPELLAGRDAAAAIIGEREARRLVTERPWAIVSGQFEASGGLASLR